MQATKCFSSERYSLIWNPWHDWKSNEEATFVDKQQFTKEATAIHVHNKEGHKEDEENTTMDVIQTTQQ